MKLERAIEEKNYQQILLQLGKGSDFRHISLIHLMDELKRVNAEQAQPIENLEQRLQDAGAILSYEKLQQVIEEQSHLPFSPEQKKNLKRLYTGLRQLSDAWKTDTLYNDAEQKKLDESATQTLLDQWQVAGLEPVIKNDINNAIEVAIETHFNGWLTQQLEAKHLEKISHIFNDNLLSSWEGPTPFMLSDQLNIQLTLCLIHYLKVDQLPEKFKHSLLEKLKGDVVLRMENYPQLMALITQEAAERNLRDKRLHGNMVPIYQEIFENKILSNWRTNLLSKACQPEMEAFLFDELHDVKISDEAFKLELKNQAISIVLKKYQSKELDEAATSLLNQHLNDVLKNVLKKECHNDEATMSWLVQPVLHRLLQEWKTTLSEECKLLLDKRLIQKFEAKLLTLSDRIYPKVSSEEFESRMQIMEQQYKDGLSVIENLQKQMVELQSKLMELTAKKEETAKNDYTAAFFIPQKK